MRCSFFYLLSRDWQYAGYLVFLLSLFFLGFADLNRLIQEQLSIYWRTLDECLLLGIWAVILLVLGVKHIWIRLGGRSWLVPYLNLLMILGFFLPFLKLLPNLSGMLFQARVVSGIDQVDHGDLLLDCSNTPDIYYIILDGYGRADMLADLYGFDNLPFLAYLQQRGFYVADESYTNYIQTIYSIPSGLNFRYIDPSGSGMHRTIYFSGLMEQNAIMTALKRCGYRTVALESGFFFTELPDVDFYLVRSIGPNEFESLLLVDFPFDILAEQLNLEPHKLSYEAHRQRVLYSFEKLATLYQMTGPKIVFAHIISPHPPFVFDPSGNAIQPQQMYYIGDGEDFAGSLDEYLSGYPAQVQFVNRRLEQVVEALLENSDQPPVIILQGDHGPGSRLDWDSPAQTCLWERTSILNAYYLPGAGADLLYPSISPVNSFRVVLNVYFGADLPLLPDSTYFSFHRLDRQAIDITSQRASRANCNPP